MKLTESALRNIIRQELKEIMDRSGYEQMIIKFDKIFGSLKELSNARQVQFEIENIKQNLVKNHGINVSKIEMPDIPVRETKMFFNVDGQYLIYAFSPPYSAIVDAKSSKVLAGGPSGPF